MKPTITYNVSASIKRSIQRGLQLLAVEDPKRYAKYVQKPEDKPKSPTGGEHGK